MYAATATVPSQTVEPSLGPALSAQHSAGLPVIQFVVSKTCLESGCKVTQLASDCKHRRCKRHCLLQSTPCTFKAHDQERRRLAVMPVQPLGAPDPFALSHPVPAVPPSQRPVPTSTQSTPDIPSGAPTTSEPRTFREEMPMSLKADWDAGLQRNIKRAQTAQMRRRHLVLVDHTVTVHVWAAVSVSLPLALPLLT